MHCNAVQHAFAVENEARTIAMVNAQIMRELGEHEVTERQVRQETITTEITETATGEMAGKNGDPAGRKNDPRDRRFQTRFSLLVLSQIMAALKNKCTFATLVVGKLSSDRRRTICQDHLEKRN